VRQELRELFRERVWLDVASKCDVLPPTLDSSLQPFQPLLPPGALQVSCKTREGVDALKAQLLAAMLPASAGTGEGGLEEEPT
jgi:hypothetical protein